MPVSPWTSVGEGFGSWSNWKCYRLVNLAIPPPGVKFKNSKMPFVQMENVSHFLRACQSPPLNLQEHDMFLTVDLYESKDPAQVLQCLLAFSRAANKVNPSQFPTAIGGRGGVSPQRTGPASPTITPAPRGRGLSNASSTASSAYGARPPLIASRTGDSVSSRWSPAKSPSQNGPQSPSVTSWSSRKQEGVTSPAWNIAQYGYMGGASQGNLGVSFGGRRQITSAGPAVPSMAEKEKRRKEKEAVEARQKQQMEEEVATRRAEMEAEEERARLEEERKWEEETQRLREEEKSKVEDDKRRWEEEERQWKITEEKRRRDEEEAERRLAQERSRASSKGDSQLRGQFLSQYKAENGVKSPGDRVKELEKELELARQRETDYERERQERSPKKSSDAKARARSRSRPPMAERTPSRQDSWARDEREVLTTAWDHQQSARPVSRPGLPPRTSSRPLPDPATAAAPPPAKVKGHRTGESAPKVRSHNTGSRPLPDPTAYAAKTQTPSPSATRAPVPVPVPAHQPSPQPTYSRELGATAERDAEDRRRHQSQARTKAGHVASKSLLEREMEMERQRQREWEEAQKETAKARPTGDGVDGIGGGIGGRWDVNQWSGFTGGDTQNRGSQGIGSGRRQIVGPRPLPGTPGGGGR